RSVPGIDQGRLGVQPDFAIEVVDAVSPRIVPGHGGDEVVAGAVVTGGGAAGDFFAAGIGAEVEEALPGVAAVPGGPAFDGEGGGGRDAIGEVDIVAREDVVVDAVIGEVDLSAGDCGQPVGVD